MTVADNEIKRREYMVEGRKFEVNSGPDNLNTRKKPFPNELKSLFSISSNKKRQRFEIDLLSIIKRLEMINLKWD